MLSGHVESSQVEVNGLALGDLVSSLGFRCRFDKGRRKCTINKNTGGSDLIWSLEMMIAVEVQTPVSYGGEVRGVI